MRLLPLAVLGVSGALLVARGVFGPIAIPVPVNSPMNLEGITALTFLLLLLTKTNKVGGAVRDDEFRFAWLAALPVLVAMAFAGALTFPMLADDYAHIWNAHHADATALWAHWTVPEPDHFFRPLVYWSYALDATWAGFTALPWRAGNLALHAANTLLVFWLCRELGLTQAGAWFGALLFGVHGSRPEAVTWVAARFDLMAVLFGLGCLLTVLRQCGWWISGGLLLCAVASKESAYAIPLMAVAVLCYAGLAWRQVAVRVAPLFVTAALAMAYRLWLLGGIGGYRDATNGSAVALKFGLASSLNALLPRFWGTLLFPLNWTGGLSVPVRATLVLAMAALVYLAWRGCVSRRQAWLGIGIATICSLPAHQFLSIGPDLEKSRVLYFASVGLAVLFGSLFEVADWKSVACGVALLGFQLAALENNLGHWKNVGELAQRTCEAGARAADAAGGPVAVTGIPNVVDGVYFLHTGYPECVKFLNARDEVREEPTPGLRLLEWDSAARLLRER